MQLDAPVDDEAPDTVLEPHDDVEDIGTDSEQEDDSELSDGEPPAAMESRSGRQIRRPARYDD